MHDTISRNDLARRPVTPGTRPIAIDQDRLYFNEHGESWSWQLPDIPPALVPGADLYDVASAVRVLRAAPGTMQIRQPLLAIEVIVPGQGAVLSSDGRVRPHPGRRRRARRHPHLRLRDRCGGREWARRDRRRPRRRVRPGQHRHLHRRHPRARPRRRRAAAALGVAAARAAHLRAADRGVRDAQPVRQRAGAARSAVELRERWRCAGPLPGVPPARWCRASSLGSPCRRWRRLGLGLAAAPRLPLTLLRRVPTAPRAGPGMPVSPLVGGVRGGVVRCSVVEEGAQRLSRNSHPVVEEGAQRLSRNPVRCAGRVPGVPPARRCRASSLGSPCRRWTPVVVGAAAAPRLPLRSRRVRRAPAGGPGMPSAPLVGGVRGGVVRCSVVEEGAQRLSRNPHPVVEVRRRAAPEPRNPVRCAGR